VHSCQSHNVYQSYSVIRLLHHQRIFCIIIIHSFFPLGHYVNDIWKIRFETIIITSCFGTQFWGDSKMISQNIEINIWFWFHCHLYNLNRNISCTMYVMYSCAFLKDHNINYHGITKMRKGIYEKELLAFILFYLHYSKKTTLM